MTRTRDSGKTGLGKLFYAIALTDRDCDFGPVGLDHQHVHGIVCGDIAALVSDYPQVTSIKMLRKNLAPYHHVIREAAARYATIPARFGQIARDAGDVHLALQRHYRRIRQELARLDGKVEMAVKVWWKADDVFAHLLQTDDELKARRDRMLASGADTDRNTRIAFGEYVFQRMSHRRNAIGRWIAEALPATEVRFGDIHEDRAVANINLLVKKELRRQLEADLMSLSDSLGGEYDIRLDGPWAPFNFVSQLELQLGH